jgi:opacity protein-like surface antigen
MKKVLGLATLLALMTPVPGVAKDSWYDGIYIGFAAGAGRLEADLAKHGLLPQDTGEQISSNDYAKTSFTGKLIGGYRIFRYMAVEVSYTEFYDTDQKYCFLDDTGECTESRGIASPAPPPGVPFSAISSSAWTVEFPTKGYSAYVVGLLPFGANDAFEGFLKVGAINWETNAVGYEEIVGNFVPPKLPLVPPTNDPVSKKLDGTDFAVGTGISFNHPSGVTLRGEFEYYDIKDLEQSMLLSLAVLYNF